MIRVQNMKTGYSGSAPFLAEEALFPEGMISAIIGKNGSGKSTFLKALAGQRPYEGSVLIDEEELRDFAPWERAGRIAYLPQNVRAVRLPVRTLVEHGRFSYHGTFRRLSGEDERHVEEALQLTGMKDYVDRDLTCLSGGELRRAYLAMVIAQNSSMVLLDEPTTFLDLQYQEEFYRILEKLKHSGKGIITICHDIEQSFAYSDRIFLMEEHRLHPGMTPEELALDEKSLRANFAAALKPSDREDSLYPYVLVR